MTTKSISTGESTEQIMELQQKMQSPSAHTRHQRLRQAVETYLPPTIQKQLAQTLSSTAQACYFAPSNIAMIKYWGKRDRVLRLPVNDSISISLGERGATCQLSIIHPEQSKGHALSHTKHIIELNHQRLDPQSAIAVRTANWLQAVVGDQCPALHIRIQLNIPLGAGLASSACWFAALTGAIAELYQLQDFSLKQASLLARLGSGSACRSVTGGWMHWQRGLRADGSDSYAQSLDLSWPALRIGLWMIEAGEKPMNSSQAMLHTQRTSKRFATWADETQAEIKAFINALQEHDFSLVGEIAENCACRMHDTIIDSQPSLDYSKSTTYAAREAVRQARADGCEVYFTQDAGPNLKLLFLAKDQAQILARWPHLEVIEAH